MSRADLPQGFRVDQGPATLIADERYVDELKRLGLGHVAGWEERLAAGDRSGRGTTARLELASGKVALLKRLRRGGLLAPLWNDRFVTDRRPFDNLRVPLEAARRGLATPAPLALLLLRDSPGLFRAWLATDYIADATDLRTRFTSDAPPSRAELACAIELVRAMHDLGLEHRDLNLGNLMIQRGPVPRAWVVDLDGAHLHDAPLRFAARQRALRRLERSHAKAGLDPDLAGLYYEFYAADDGALAARLQGGRRTGRFWIAVHRLGWRR